MKADGSDRVKVLSTPIFEVLDISPDGRRAIVFQPATKVRDSPYETAAAPLATGNSMTICSDLCEAMWGNHGKFFCHPYGRGKRENDLSARAPRRDTGATS